MTAKFYRDCSKRPRTIFKLLLQVKLFRCLSQKYLTSMDSALIVADKSDHTFIVKAHLSAEGVAGVERNERIEVSISIAHLSAPKESSTPKESTSPKELPTFHHFRSVVRANYICAL